MSGDIAVPSGGGHQLRIGTDIVEVESVRRSIEHFGARYLDRVYSTNELGDCRSRSGRVAPERLAARFAAKECAVKALRPPTGFAYTDIDVFLDVDGAPYLRRSGAFARWAETLSITSEAVSLSHDGDFAIATYIASITSEGTS